MFANYRRLLPFFLLLLVYSIAFPVALTGIAGHYAHISMEMVLHGNWLQPHYIAEPSTERPLLLLWLNAFSYKIFGFNSFAYRLPALIFWCVGIWAVYHFGKRWYNPKIGYGAALIMASSQGAFLMTNDVGSHTLLTAMTAIAFWQISIVIHRIHEEIPFTKRLLPIFWSAMAIAGALLLNGVILAFALFAALFIYILLNRQWSLLHKPDWVVIILTIFLLLSPIIFALHTQEQKPFLTIICELLHYFWVLNQPQHTEGASEIYGFGYFLRSMIWRFLPWGIVLYVAVFQRFRDLFHFLKEYNFFKNTTQTTSLKAQSTYEWLSLAGFMIPFVTLMFAPYKSPLHIYITFPMASILVAVYFRRLIDDNLPIFRIWTAIHFFTSLILAIAAVVLCEWAFTKWWAMLAAVLVFCLTIYAYYRTEDPMRKLRGVAVGGMIGLNFILNLHIFPTVFNYQAASEAGKYVNTMGLSKNLYQDGSGNGLLGFYSQKIIPVVSIDSLKTLKKPVYFYANSHTLELFYKQNFTQFALVKTFDDYNVKHPTLRFLDADTRDSIVKKQYLLRIR